MPSSVERRSIKLPQSRQEAGLPEGRITRRLHAAGRTVLEIELPGVPPLHRLYARRAQETEYRLLHDPGKKLSVEHAVAGEAPWLFARLVQWSFENGHHGATAIGLLRIGLDEAHENQEVDLNGVLPADACVISLLRSNDAGTVLDLVVLSQQQLEEDSRRARYAICRLDIVDCKLIELDVLRGIHF